MKVIGVAGQMQNGKDTVADYLAEKINWGRHSFGFAVKKIYCDAFDVDFEFIEKWKTNPEPPPGFNKNVREGLQFIGDGFREIQPLIWIDLCFKEIVKPVVLSDVRYINETCAIKSKDDEGIGLTILTYRPGFENDDPNGSEAQLKPIIEWCKNTGKEGWISNWNLEVERPLNSKNIDVFLINDGTIEDLYSKIDDHVVSKYNFETGIFEIN